MYPSELSMRSSECLLEGRSPQRIEGINREPHERVTARREHCHTTSAPIHEARMVGIARPLLDVFPKPCRDTLSFHFFGVRV